MISGEYKTLSQFERRAARFRSYLLGRTAICGALTLGLVAGLAPRAAKAGPQGTVVVGGAVDMAQTGTHTEFTQHTQTAILNHNSFDIKTNESVNFAQPNSRALAVNRIVGSDLPTSIAGKLTANGNVWVLNPSGVAIQGTAQVNVNGLVATTASISDEAIMAGRRSFSGAPDGSAVTNAGSIDAGDGSVVLVAPIVDNSGTITTHGSDVAMGAGSGFTVDFEGDGLTRFEVTPGKGVSLSNAGTISAQGGAAYISAASAEAVQTSVVSIGGKVEATRIEEKGGVIVISAGDKGVTEVSGEIDASQAEGHGGRVVVTGDLVDVKGTAVVDASGVGGGGSVEIGGAFHGGAIASDVVVRAGAPATTPLPTARRTAVHAGARIVADAGTQGDGGDVVVWADEATGFSGHISARGGAAGGDGGNAEVSGKERLGFDGTVDLSAAHGATGTLLLDPRDIVIGSAATDDGQLAAGTPSGQAADVIASGDGAANEDFEISAAALSAAAADIDLEATRDITVGSAVSATVNMAFKAGRNIAVNASLATTENLSLTADADFGGSNKSDGIGNISFGANGALSGDAVTLTTAQATTNNQTPQTLTLGQISAGTLNVDAGGAIADTNGKAISVTGATSLSAFDDLGNGNAADDVFFDITLDNGLHDFDSGAPAGDALTFRGANVTLSDINLLTLGASTARGNVSLTAKDVAITGALSLGGTGTAGFVSTATGNFNLGAAGAATEFSVNDAELALINAGTVSVDSGGKEVRIDSVTNLTEALTIDAGAGVVRLVNTSSGLGNMTVTASNGFVMEGALSLGANTLSVDAGDVSAGFQDLTAGALVVQNGGSVQFERTNAVTGAATIDGGAVTFGASDVANDGTSSFGSLTVTHSDSILQNPFGALTVTGNTGLTTSGSVTLDDAGNDFGGAVSVDTTDGGQPRGAVTLVDANAITLGAITASSLGVTATDVTVAGGATVDASGAADFVFGGATGNLDLTTDFAGITAGAFSFTNDVGNIAVAGLNAVDGSSARVDATFSAPGNTVSLSGSNTVAGLGITASDVVVSGTTDASGTVSVTFGGTTGDLDLTTDFAGITAGAFSFTNDVGNIAVAGLNAVDGSSARVDATFSAPGNTVFLSGSNTVAGLGITASDVVLSGTADASGTASVTFGGTTGDLDLTTDFAGITAGAFSFTNDVGNIAVAGFDAVNGSATPVGATFSAPTGAVFFSGANTMGSLDVTARDVETAVGGSLSVGTDTGGGDFDGPITITNSVPSNTAQLGGAADGDTTNLDVTDADIAAWNFGSLTVSNQFGGTSAILNLAALDTTNDPDATKDIFIQALDLTVTGPLALGTGTLGLNSTGAAINVGGALGDFDLSDTELANISAGALALDSNGGGIRFFGFDFSGSVQTVTADAASDDLATRGAVSFEDDPGTVGADPLTVANLTVTGASSITQDIAAPLIVSGEASFASNGSISLSSPDNAFSNSSLALDAGGNATVVEVDGFAFDAVTVTGDLSVLAGGDIIDTLGQGISVGGSTTLTATNGGDIVLDNTGAGAHDFAETAGTPFNASANNVTVSDVDAIVLGDVDATGNLTVLAGGSITDDGVSTGPGSDVDVAGVTSLSANGDIALDDISTDFDADGIGSDRVDATGASITLSDATAIRLGQVTASGNLTVAAGGAIADTDLLAITVGGATSLLATDGGAGRFDIALDNGLHDFDEDISGDALSFDGANVTLTDIDRLTLGTSSTTGALSATAVDFDITGTVTVAGGTGTATLSSPLFLLSDANSVAQVDADTNDFTLGFTNTDAGNLDSGTTTFTGTDAVDGAVTVVDFDSGTAIGNVVLNSAQSIFIGEGTTFPGTATATFRGDLTMLTGAGADGDILQILGDVGLVVLGNTRFTAADAVLLSDADNDFQGTFNGSGGTVSLVDANAVALGALDVGGNLSVTAGGAITDTATDAITVGGATSLVATDGASGRFDIALDNGLHDFDDDDTGDALSFDGAAVTLTDVDRLTLGASSSLGDVAISSSDVALAGALDVNLANGAPGNITFANPAGGIGLGLVSVGGGTVAYDFSNADAQNVDAGTVTFRADHVGGTIASDAFDSGGTDATASFGTIVLDGNQVLLSVLGGTDIFRGDLAIESNDSVQQGLFAGGTGTVSVTGNTSITVFDDIGSSGNDAGPITLASATNDFGGAVSASGSAVSLRDANAILLDQVTAGAGLTVTAGGAITDTDTSAISVTGVTSLTAGGDIVLDGDDADDTDRPHDFSAASAFNASGQAISVVDANSILLGAVTGNSLALRSNDVEIATSVGVSGLAAFTNGAGDEMSIGTSDADPASWEISLAELDRIVASEISLTTAGNGGGGIEVNGAKVAESLRLDSGTDGVQFVTGPNSIGGNLSITAGDTVEQDNLGALTVVGTTDIQAGDGSAGFADIQLSLASNDFVGKLSATGGDIALVDVNGLQLGTIDANVNSDPAVTPNVGLLFVLLNNGGLSDTNLEKIDVAGLAVLDAANGTIALDNGLHDFNSAAAGVATQAVDAFGTAITLTDIDSIKLGDIDTAGNLTVDAGGTISDTNGRSVLVGGTTRLLAQDGGGTFHDILLDNISNDFDSDGSGSPVNAAGANLSLGDATSILLGDIDATGGLTVRSGGTISDGAAAGAGNDIDVAGATSLSATGSITLDDVTNDFSKGPSVTGPVDAAGTNITLVDANDIRLGHIEALGNLTVAALSGDILDSDATVTGTGVEVAGRTSLSASGDILLDDIVNDFDDDDTGDRVDATANTIALGDADSIVLGAIDAAGDLRVAAGGSITDSGQGIAVGGATRLSAGGDVALDDTINDFDDDGSGDVVNASGDNLTLIDANSIVLGDIDVTGNLTVLAQNGSITDDGTTSPGGDIDVGGLLRLEATTTVVLDDLFNDFGTVDAIAPTVSLRDRNAIVLGGITTDTLTVTAGGAITDTGTKAIRVTGDTSLLASGTVFGDFFDITLDGDDAITTDVPHDFGGTFTAEGADISVVDANAILLGDITAHATTVTPAPDSNGDLSILAGGDITQVGGTSVVAPGSGDIRTTSGAITLTEAGNDLADELNAASSTVALNATGDVSVVDVDSIALGASSGANFDLSSTDLSAAGTLAFATITLRNRAADGIVLGNAANDGDAAAYDITDAEVASMQADLVSLTTSGGGIEVQGAGFGTESLVLDAGVGGVSFSTATTRVAGDLTVTSGGQIDQTAQGAVEVAGKTSLTASGAVALGSAANNFDSDAAAGGDAADEVDVSGTAVSLRDADAIALGAVTASSLTVTAGGSITDTVGDSISVTGATSMTALNGSDAFDIRLDGDDAISTDRPHDFSATASFSARGEDILIAEASAIRFGTVQTGDGAGGTADATIDTGNDGDLTVDAGGDISGAGAMLVRGDAAFAAPGAITLGGANDFRKIVDADAGTVVLNDTSGIALGTVTADTLTVTANGTITDTAGRVITVGGNTSLGATDGASAFHDIDLDATAHDFAGTFSAVGEDLSVLDQNALDLGAVTLHGDGSADSRIAGGTGAMTIVTGGDLTQTGIITAPGEVSLVTPGNVTFGRANRFGSSVNVDAGEITLADADGIRLGTIRAAGGLTVGAGGAILDTDGRSIQVTGVTSLSAESSGGDFFDILLDNANAGDVHELGTRVDAAGEDIRLTNVDALLLGTVAPHDDGSPDRTIDNGNNGDLTVRAGGTVTQQVALTIPGELDVTALDFGAGDRFDVLLALANRIGGGISLSAEDASIRNVGGTTRLGSITTHDNSGGVVDTTINNGNDGDLTVASTAGSIVDTGGKAIVVAGTTSLFAGNASEFFDIALDNADTHDFRGVVNATGEDIVLDDRNAIVLGAIDANESGEDAGSADADETIAFFDDNGDGAATAADGTASAGDLTVRAGGAITETGAGIDVEGRTRLEARKGDSRFDITLNRGPHDFDSNTADPDAQQEVDIVAANAVLTDTSAIKLGDIDATGDLSVTAAGSITDTDGEAVTVGGATALVARDGANFYDIALDNADTHDFTGAVSATGEDIVLADRNAIVLGAIDANESGEDAGSADADETIAFFDDNGDGAANASDGMTSAGDLTVRAGGTITETGAGIDVEGRTRLEARRGDSRFDVTLNRGPHDFDSNTADPDAQQEVDIVAANAVLTDTSAIKLGDVDLTGNLSVTAGGSVTDTAGETILAPGTTEIHAETLGDFFDIVLDNAHDFDVAAFIGEDIVIRDANDITLAGVAAHADASADATHRASSPGSLTVTAAGTIGGSLEAGGNITTDGVVTLDAGGSVVLENEDNDFARKAGDVNVSAPAGDVSLVDADTLPLGTVTTGAATFRTLAGDITNAANAGVAGKEIDVASLDVTADKNPANPSQQGSIRLDLNTVGVVSADAKFAVIRVENGGVTLARLNTDQSSHVEAVDGTLTIIGRIVSGGDVSLRSDTGDVTFDPIVLTKQLQGLDGETIDDSSTLAGALVIAGGQLVIAAPEGTINLPSKILDGAHSKTIRLVAGYGGSLAAEFTPEGGTPVGLTVADLVELGVDPGVADQIVNLDAGRAMDLQIGRSMSVTVPRSHGPKDGAFLTLDIPGGKTARLRATGGETPVSFALGDANFIKLTADEKFDPLNLPFLGLEGFRDKEVLFEVTGNLNVVAETGHLRFNVQNTSPFTGANDGKGTIIGGVFVPTQVKGAKLDQLSLFGSVESRSGTGSAVIVRPEGFAASGDHTVNGCIIGTLSSCQPLGSLTLSLDFPDGLLLGVKFLNPDEDLDDPFTNRGDEEEWE